MGGLLAFMSNSLLSVIFVLLMMVGTIIKQYTFIVFILFYFVFRGILHRFVVNINKYKPIYFGFLFLFVLCSVFVSICFSIIPGGGSGINAVSMLYAKGYPLYHSLSEHFYYNSFYGPIFYMIFSVPVFVFHSIAPIIFSSNLISLFPFLISILLLWVIIGVIVTEKGLIQSTLTQPFFVSLYILFFAYLGGFPISGSEPISSFLVLVAIYMAVTRSRTVNLITFPIIVAVCMNIKSHEFIYFLPVFWMLIERRKISFKDAPIFLFFFSLAFSMPFLFARVSFIEYVGLLQRMVDYPKNWGYLFESINPLLLLLSPFIFFSRKLEIFRNHNVLLLFATSLLVLPITAYHGGGAHHLIPLIPSYIFLYLQLLAANNDSAKQKNIKVVFLLVWLVFFSGLYRSCVAGYFYLERARITQSKIIEFSKIINAYQNSRLIFLETNEPFHPIGFPFSVMLYLKNQPVYLENEFLSNYLTAKNLLPIQLIEPIKSNKFDKIILASGADPFRYEGSMYFKKIQKNTKQEYYNIFIQNFKIRYKIELPQQSLAFRLLVIQKWANFDYEPFLYKRSINMFPASYQREFFDNYELQKSAKYFDIYTRKFANRFK